MARAVLGQRRMSFLQHNLNGLVKHARLRESILACLPSRARVVSDRVHPQIRAGDVAMHSAVDPVAEAEVFAARAQLDDIDYVLLFGIGAGHAMEALRRRGAPPIVVVEPDLEVLRLCLEMRALCVDDCQVVRDAVAVRALLRDVMRRGQRVLLLGWPPSVRLHGESYREISRHVSEAMDASRVAGNTWDLRMSGWIENVLLNLPRALAHAQVSGLAGTLRGVPAFLLAAGPSLERNIAQLRHLDGRGVIFTVNTAVPALDRHGVRPDVVACVESIDVSSHLRDSPAFAGARLAVSLPSNPAHFRLSPRGLWAFSDHIDYYSRWLEQLGAATVLESGCCSAHAAFSTAALLGCDPIVLVGQDAALTGGEFYSRSTHFGAMRLTSVSGEEGRVEGDEAKVRLHDGAQVAYHAGRPVGVHPVEAWGGEGTVLSTLPLDYVRVWYEEVVRETDVRVVNSTEGGARLAGVPEARLADVVAGLPGARVDFEAVAGLASPASAQTLACVREGLAVVGEQVREAARAGQRAMAMGTAARQDAVTRLKERTRGLLLQGYARRDVMGVVERGGDLPELCAVLIRRARSLSTRLEACENAVESLFRRAA